MLSTVPIQVVSGGPKTLQEKICRRTLTGANKRKTPSCVLCFRASDEFLLFSSSTLGNPEPSHSTVIRHRGGWPLRSSRSLLAPTLTLLSGGFQLAVALSVNLDLSPCEHIVWRHIAYGAMQADIVVAVHILLDQAFCIFR